jgi:hypothetical protein
MPDSLLKLLVALFALSMIYLKHYLIKTRPEYNLKSEIAVIQKLITPPQVILQNHCYLGGAFDNAVYGEIVNNTMKLCFNKGEFNYATFPKYDEHSGSFICNKNISNGYTDKNHQIYVQTYKSHPVKENGITMATKSWSFGLTNTSEMIEINFGGSHDICKDRLINFVGLSYGDLIVVPFNIYN